MPGAAASVGMNIKTGQREEIRATGPWRNSAPLKASACSRHVSLSLSEASRAMASVGPRPIVTRLVVPTSASDEIAPIEFGRGAQPIRQPRDRTAKTFVFGPGRGEAQQRREGRDERLARRDAELRSGTYRQDDVARRDERAVGGIDHRHGQCARRLGARGQLDEIVAPSGLRDGEKQLVLEAQSPPIDAGNVRRRLGDREYRCSARSSASRTSPHGPSSRVRR